MVCELNAKTAGGCPAASYLSCLAKKGNPKKSPPVCRPCGVPSIRRKRAGLRNSPDPLRGHVLKQCSPNPTARSRLIEAALRGNAKRFCVRYAHDFVVVVGRASPD